jgi:hypothetical protein
MMHRKSRTAAKRICALVAETTKWTNKKKLAAAVTAAVGMVAIASQARAETIAWQTAQTMSTDTDVSNLGEVLDAASFYGSDATVNGVTFSPLTGSGGNYSDGSDISVFAPNGTYGGSSFAGSASYEDIVSQIGFGYFGNGSVTLSGLTNGVSYQVQVWSSYAYAVGNDATTLTGTAPATLTPEDNEYSIGTFVATGPTEGFGLDYNTQYDLINAISVTTAVPEPASLGLLAVAGAGLLRRGRRRV